MSVMPRNIAKSPAEMISNTARAGRACGEAQKPTRISGTSLQDQQQLDDGGQGPGAAQLQATCRKRTSGDFHRDQSPWVGR